MDSTTSFSKQVIEAVKAKSEWFDTTELPKVLNSYRNIKGYAGTLTNVLMRKGLLQEDPYKHEENISGIKPIDNSPFLDTERAVVLGRRLSDYDNMLEYICTYVRFNVEDLGMDTIKKISAFNSSLPINAISNTSTNPTLKALAEVVNSIKAGTDTMSISMVNDIVPMISKELISINNTLKSLMDFQRERYKANVREKILEKPGFDSAQAASAPNAAVALIRKEFASTMNRQPFYMELIQEIVAEEYGPNKAALQKKLLEKFDVKPQKGAAEEEINSHELIMDAVRILGSSAGQLEQVAKKLKENKTTLDNQQNTFWRRVKKVLRKLFRMGERPVVYKVSVTESITRTTRVESVQINDFITDLGKRARIYAAISSRNNAGFQKLEKLGDVKILDFLNKQLAECQKILVLLEALDAFFKATASGSNGLRIKGLKIEISALKGIFHKTNQQKAEFAAQLEEENQMKRLSSINAAASAAAGTANES